MAAESENPKAEYQTNTKHPNPDEEEELEEGAIGGDDESSKKSMAVIQQPHPLEDSWTFWFNHPAARSKKAKWGSSMSSIYTFSTIEKFWSLYNIIHHPSMLTVGADFYCFKQKIKPIWEDPVCANGGKWIITFPRGKSDTCWLYTLLAMIGEQFDHGDEICGAAVNVRVRQERIALWTKNASNEAAQTSIGKQWKELLDYSDTIGFIFHHDGSAKKRYTA